MFFTYPIQATQDNWVHDCIQSALEEICTAIDAGQEIPEWPNVVPAPHRGRIRRRRKLSALLGSFAEEARKFTISDRAEFLAGFRQQNQIAGLLDGSVALPVFNSKLQLLLHATEAICEEGFSLLGKMDVRVRHYQIIYEHLKSKTCPFCGTEPFDAPTLASEDEDHYLARSAYPMAAANFANLVPWVQSVTSAIKVG
jgi:hypothetical protein